MYRWPANSTGGNQPGIAHDDATARNKSMPSALLQRIDRPVSHSAVVTRRSISGHSSVPSRLRNDSTYSASPSATSASTASLPMAIARSSIGASPEIIKRMMSFGTTLGAPGARGGDEFCERDERACAAAGRRARRDRGRARPARRRRNRPMCRRSDSSPAGRSRRARGGRPSRRSPTRCRRHRRHRG